MNACRAALLLVALTCSAQAHEAHPEVVSFDSDHVRIKLRFPIESALQKPAERDEHAKEHTLPIQDMAHRLCGVYGKYYSLIGVQSILFPPSLLYGPSFDMNFNFACLKEQPRP